MKMLFTYCLGFFLFAGSLAFYNEEDVLHLSNNLYDRKVAHSRKVWVVEFYATWCKYCKEFVSEFKKAAKALKGIVEVAAVDIDEQEKLAKRFHVNSYPTVLIFKNGRSVEYNGDMRAQPLIDAALRAVRDVTSLRMRTMDSGYPVKETHLRSRCRFNPVRLEAEKRAKDDVNDVYESHFNDESLCHNREKSSDLFSKLIQTELQLHNWTKSKNSLRCENRKTIFIVVTEGDH